MKFSPNVHALLVAATKKGAKIQVQLEDRSELGTLLNHDRESLSLATEGGHYEVFRFSDIKSLAHESAL